jgi:hypothetical protein
MDSPTPEVLLEKRGVVWRSAFKQPHRLEAPDREVSHASATPLRDRSPSWRSICRSGWHNG